MNTPSGCGTGMLVREILEAVADEKEVQRPLVDDRELADDDARRAGA